MIQRLSAVEAQLTEAPGRCRCCARVYASLDGLKQQGCNGLVRRRTRSAGDAVREVEGRNGGTEGLLLKKEGHFFSPSWQTLRRVRPSTAVRGWWERGGCRGSEASPPPRPRAAGARRLAKPISPADSGAARGWFGAEQGEAGFPAHWGVERKRGAATKPQEVSGYVGSGSAFAGGAGRAGAAGLVIAIRGVGGIGGAGGFAGRWGQEELVADVFRKLLAGRHGAEAVGGDEHLDLGDDLEDDRDADRQFKGGIAAVAARRRRPR